MFKFKLYKLSYPISDVIEECREIDFGEVSKSESDLKKLQLLVKLIGVNKGRHVTLKY